MRPSRLPGPVHAANETMAFLLELAMLVALAWWGARSGSTLPRSIALAAGAPLLAAVVWALFASPKAKIRLPMAGVLAVKALAFGSAGAALYALGWHASAAAFVAVSLVNTLIAALDRDAAMRAHRSR
ncbi:MAG TPA: YrdB family protein [Polyangiaceae bacterium]